MELFNTITVDINGCVELVINKPTEYYGRVFYFNTVNALDKCMEFLDKYYIEEYYNYAD